MRYLADHWAFDPFAVIALVLVAWHEIGLARLARRSRPDRTRQRRLRSAWFYAGLLTLLISVESPIDYWSDRYFFVHMIQHLLLMFAAPVLIVAGAPWQPLLAAGGFLLRPWVAVIAFNLTMVLWHLPGPFDLGARDQAAHIWLVHGSF